METSGFFISRGGESGVWSLETRGWDIRDGIRPNVICFSWILLFVICILSVVGCSFCLRNVHNYFHSLLGFSPVFSGNIRGKYMGVVFFLVFLFMHLYWLCYEVSVCLCVRETQQCHRAEFNPFCCSAFNDCDYVITLGLEMEDKPDENPVSKTSVTIMINIWNKSVMQWWKFGQLFFPNAGMCKHHVCLYRAILGDEVNTLFSDNCKCCRGVCWSCFNQVLPKVKGGTPHLQKHIKPQIKVPLNL